MSRDIKLIAVPRHCWDKDTGLPLHHQMVLQLQMVADGSADKKEFMFFGYEKKLFRENEKAEWIDSK